MLFIRLRACSVLYPNPDETDAILLIIYLKHLTMSDPF